MDGCVLLTSTPSCVVSPRGDPSGCALGITRRGETTHSGVDVNNTHPSMINPLIWVFGFGASYIRDFTDHVTTAPDCNANIYTASTIVSLPNQKSYLDEITYLKLT